MKTAKKNIAWGYYSKEKGVWPETFHSRTSARTYKEEATEFFGHYKFKLVQVQLKPYVTK